ASIVSRKPRKDGERKSSETWRPWRHITLADVIAAGILRPPLRLFRKYKGQTIEATLLPDGKVQFQGKAYDSCSTAAEQARSTVTGRKMNTNGWAFWQSLDGDGNKKPIDAARKQLFQMKNRS